MWHTKPHKDLKQRKLEIFNELTVAASLYFLFIFTDLCPDQTRKDDAGWGKVYLIGFNIVVNIYIYFSELIFPLK
jgi:hypothetical protein